MHAVYDDPDLQFFNVLGCDVMDLACTTNDTISPVYKDEGDVAYKRIPSAILELSSQGQEKWMHKLTAPMNKGGYEKYIFDVSEDQREKIENVMFKYDCTNFLEIMKYMSDFGEKPSEKRSSGTLKILHMDKVFEEMMTECKTNYSHATGFSRDQLLDSISDIMQCK